MDAGLLLAGVSTVAKPPGAPPGKEIETPPAEAKNEFKNVLKQAEGKSSGEVAEAEPNAQPQKLDSTEDTKQVQSELSLDWASLLTLPSRANQKLAPADEMVADSNTAPAVEAQPLPQLAVVSAEVQEVLNVVDVKSTKVDLATPVTPLASASLEQPKIDVPQGVEGKTAITQLAHSEGLPSEKALATQTTLAKPQLDPEVGAMTLVQSPTVEPKPELKATEPTLAVEGVEILAEAPSEQASAGQGDTEQSFSGQQSAQPEFKIVAPETTQKVEQSAGMTPAERKAVVHQLTQKIEALAVNSVRNEVTVRMEPAELGSVLVQVSRGVGEMTASLSATNEKLQNTLHEARNELAATLTAKTNTTVKVEIISADSTPTGSAANSQQQSLSGHQPKQEAITKFFQAKTHEQATPATKKARIQTSQIDLES